MTNSTVEQFAAELKKPVAELLKQLESAGVQKASGSDNITAGDKEKLLAFLRKSHDTQGSGTISIGRKKTERSTIDGVQVETRRTRRQVVIPSGEDLAAEAKAKEAEQQQAAEAEAAQAAAAQAEAEAQARLAAEEKARAEQAAAAAEQQAREAQAREAEQAAADTAAEKTEPQAAEAAAPTKKQNDNSRNRKAKPAPQPVEVVSAE